MGYKIMELAGLAIAGFSLCCVGTEDIRGLIFGIIGICGLLMCLFAHHMRRINYERRKLNRRIRERRAQAIEESNRIFDDSNDVVHKAV